MYGARLYMGFSVFTFALPIGQSAESDTICLVGMRLSPYHRSFTPFPNVHSTSRDPSGYSFCIVQFSSAVFLFALSLVRTHSRLA